MDEDVIGIINIVQDYGRGYVPEWNQGCHTPGESFEQEEDGKNREGQAAIHLSRKARYMGLIQRPRWSEGAQQSTLEARQWKNKALFLRSRRKDKREKWINYFRMGAELITLDKFKE
ncbi:hypothetical protein KQX54_000757 [Cotesia glomerata]|uniref:Uncharacterized protein n=1 Tax=Cotesia glomerata TaxID=32391 RepID=A0AAV7ITJ5_COTGL|nr:hypothetical protein KQX54_000757 [Cotesia glomerata]